MENDLYFKKYSPSPRDHHSLSGSHLHNAHMSQHHPTYGSSSPSPTVTSTHRNIAVSAPPSIPSSTMVYGHDPVSSSTIMMLDRSPSRSMIYQSSQPMDITQDFHYSHHHRVSDIGINTNNKTTVSSIASPSPTRENYYTSEELKRFNEYNRFLVMSSPGRQKKFYASLSAEEYDRFSDYLKTKTEVSTPSPMASNQSGLLGVKPQSLLGIKPMSGEPLNSYIDTNKQYTSSYSYPATLSSSYYDGNGLEKLESSLHSPSTNNHQLIGSKYSSLPSNYISNEYYRGREYSEQRQFSNSYSDLDEYADETNIRYNKYPFSGHNSSIGIRNTSVTRSSRSRSRTPTNNRYHKQSSSTPHEHREPLLSTPPRHHHYHHHHHETSSSFPHHHSPTSKMDIRVPLLPTPDNKKSKEVYPKLSVEMPSSKSSREKKYNENFSYKENEVKILEERIKQLEHKLKHGRRKIEELSNKKRRLSINNSRAKKRSRERISNNNEMIEKANISKKAKINKKPLPTSTTKSTDKKEIKRESIKEKDLELPTATSEDRTEEMKKYKIPKKVESKHEKNKTSPTKSLTKTSNLIETKSANTKSSNNRQFSEEKTNTPNTDMNESCNKEFSSRPTKRSSPLREEEIKKGLVHYPWCKMCHQFFENSFEYLKHIHRDRHNTRMGNSDYHIIKKVEDKINNDMMNQSLKHSSSSSSAYSDLSMTSQVNKEEYLGTEFVYPLESFYCDLCAKFLSTTQQAQEHLHSERHLALYKKYTKKNVEFYKRFNQTRLDEFKSTPFIYDLFRNKQLGILSSGNKSYQMDKRKSTASNKDDEIKQFLDSLLNRLIKNLDNEINKKKETDESKDNTNKKLANEGTKLATKEKDNDTLGTNQAKLTKLKNPIHLSQKEVLIKNNANKDKPNYGIKNEVKNNGVKATEPKNITSKKTEVSGSSNSNKVKNASLEDRNLGNDLGWKKTSKGDNKKSEEIKFSGNKIQKRNIKNEKNNKITEKEIPIRIYERMEDKLSGDEDEEGGFDVIDEVQ